MSIVARLARVPLFHHLPERDLERIAAAAHHESFDTGEIVVEIGDPGRSLYLVMEGSVQVLYPARNSDFELARLGAGEFFGEMALLNDKPRSATVRAAEPMEALVVDKDDFRSIILESPGVAVRLLESLSRRIRHADEQISGLSDKAVRDPLTGLLNHGAFTERVAAELDRVQRYDDAFSLILVDLDQLEAINDSLGHDAGDEVLAWIGRLLTELTRAADMPFRMGGGGFAVVCPSTSGDVARAVAQRIVSVAAEARPPVGRDLTVTLSAGYSSCPEHGTSQEALYGMADGALLRAKESGRNCVAAPVPSTR